MTQWYDQHTYVYHFTEGNTHIWKEDKLRSILKWEEQMCLKQLTISITAGSMFPSADDWLKIDAVLEKNELIIWILSVFWSAGSVVMATISVKLLKAVSTFSAAILSYKRSNTKCLDSFLFDYNNVTKLVIYTCTFLLAICITNDNHS